VQVPPIVKANFDRSFRDYWTDRLRQHLDDRYKGRQLAKMPEDLRTYQHVIEASKPDVIIELGSGSGGSAVWFADQLQVLCGGGSVITVDISEPQLPLGDPRVTFVQGDLAVASERVHAIVPLDKRVMLVDDSAHTYQSTMNALTLYADLVTPGCWFVVEDGVVDESISVWNGAGVQPAIRDFLNTENGSRFEQQDLALYGLTTDFGGWLEAKS